MASKELPHSWYTHRVSQVRASWRALLPLVAALSLFACGGHPEDAARTATVQSLVTTIYQINSGGPATGSFAADQFSNGGGTYVSPSTVSTAGVTNAAPAAVYQSERHGDYSYVFGSLTPNATYTVRLHFAEVYYTQSGSRVFNVVINGTQVLTSFDIFAQAGGAFKALVRDFAATASSSGQITIHYVNVRDNAKSSGIEILSQNQSPTVATTAAANPSPVTSNTSSLSVLGADDGGESQLSYAWSTTGTPPAPVSFSANGSNAAKNTVATFGKAGSYSLLVTITDASGASTTSSVNVVVNQTLTSISVSPGSAQVTTGGTQQFTASALDQFGAALTQQPSFAWASSGGGSIAANGLFTAGSAAGGPFSITASNGSANGSAAVTITQAAPPPVGGAPVYQINSGGPATGSFAADQFANGGGTYVSPNTVSTDGVTNAAPAALYQSERHGDYSYVFGSLTPNATYTVRLHFAEVYYTQSGSRVFNVVINGTQVLTSFDIFAQAGALKALVRDFAVTASSSGQITIHYVNVVDNAKSSGIEILSSGGAQNQPPTVATAAAANPSSVTSNTSNLSVLGADDGGESQLSYAWSTTGTPPAPVSFSANGSNAAKNTVATFGKAGSYALLVTISDASGASTTSSVNVVVNQTLTSISVSPGSAQVTTGGTQQFTASALDQFGAALAQQPSFAWASSGGGSIAANGLFTAGSAAGGPFSITASNGSANGSAAVTVTQAPPVGGAPVYQINSGGPATGSFAADQFANGGGTYVSPNTVSTAGVTNAAPAALYQSERHGDYSYVFGSLTPNASYTVRLHFAEVYYTQAGSRVFNVVINGTQVLTSFDIFAQAGALKALVRDFSVTASSSGQITIHYVNVRDNAKSSGIEILSSSGAPTQTLTTINVTPSSAQVSVNATQQFAATALDQSGNPMSPQPTFAWAVSGGGSINASGLFTASSAGTFTVSATSGGKTGTASVTAQSGPSAGDIAVNTSDLHQRIDGFGASDKYAVISDSEADLLFSQANGIGLSSLRVAISTNGTDISPYANAQKAAARGAIVWGAPWSPPAAWKDNNSTTNGGHLLVARYDDWATRLAGFATTMQQNGVTLYGISAQNEPEYTASWDSCIYSTDQMIAFIKVLGPKLAALSPRPKLISPETSNWGALWGYGDAILADPTASSFTDIIATHDYTYSTSTHAVTSQPIWETEVATFDAFSTDIANGLMVAGWIHRSLVVGSVSAWHYWWLKGTDNQSLISNSDVLTKRFYAVGNFSKFVRPGFRRVGLTGPVPNGVDISAYLDPASQAVIVVVINGTSTTTPVALYVPGSHTSATPWITSASDDLAAKSAIPVSGGRFSASLAGQSVTTFVVP